MPEGEEEEQEIENLLEKNNEGELPQSGKGNRLPGSPGSSDSPKEVGPRKHTPRHIIITLPKIKDKERILKVARKRRQLPTKEFPLDYQLNSQKKPCRQEGAGKKYSKSSKARTYIQDFSIQQSFHLEWKGS